MRALFLIALPLLFANALDVSWVPSDPEGPLPYSKRYRDSLRKLCELIKKSPNNLPAEVVEIRPRLEKLCYRLHNDDRRHDQQPFDGLSGLRLRPLKVLAVVGFICGGVFVAYKLGMLDKALSLLGWDEDFAENEVLRMEEIRELRLRRFFEEKED